MPLIPFNNGLRTSRDELRLDPGDLIRAAGWYYRADDEDRLWKLPGRVAVDAGPSATTPVGLAFFKYAPESASTLVVAANGKLYEADDVDAPTTWTTAKDQQGSPVDFAFTDTLHTLHDGQNRWLAWDENPGIRPLLRDYTGDWRYLSLLAPEAPSVTKITSAAAVTRPDSTSGTSHGPVADYVNQFTDLTKAYNADSNDYAYSATLQSLGATFEKDGDSRSYPVDTWLFYDQFLFTTAVGVAASHSLNVIIETTGNSTPGASTIYYYNGTTWTTAWFSKGAAIARQTIQIPVADGLTLANLKLAIAFEPTRTLDQLRIYDVYMSSGGGGDLLSPGTYYYATTEIYTGPDGTVVESAPSATGVYTIPDPNADTYGLRVTLPARVNTTAYGVRTSGLSRRIYRSTSTGVYPYLSLVGTAGIADTTFDDVFTEVPEDSVGSTLIQTVEVGGVAYNRDEPTPAFWDACYYKGAIVAIPAEDRSRIRWSMPELPESWPIPHDLLVPATQQNDQLMAIATVGEHIIIWTSKQTTRIRGLYFAGSGDFNPTAIERDDFAPGIGLVGGPRCRTVVVDPTGRNVAVWVADDGIYSTDGIFAHERGMGVTRLTDRLDWSSTVDMTQLSQSRLTYDHRLRSLVFDYLDPDGARRTLLFSLVTQHWDKGPAGNPVPKITGPHLAGSATRHITERAVGFYSGADRAWELLSDGTVWDAWTGTRDGAHFFNAAGDIESRLTTGWAYLSGHGDRFHIYAGGLLHSHWGPGEAARLEFEFRIDRTGTPQFLAKNGVSLRGSRVTPLWISRAGNAVRISVIHVGQASGAIGPLMLDGELPSRE